MFEKKLYILSVLLSLSCKAYAMIEGDEFSFSPSRSNPGPSSPTPDQEIEEVSAQSALFPYDKQKVTFTWPKLVAATRNEKEDQRARNLYFYIDAIIDRYGHYNEEERKSATQEKEELLSELKRLKAENEELKSQAARSSDIS